MNSSRRRGKKGIPHPNPADPPRIRGLTRRGRGNFDNDRPPVFGMVGRQSKTLRLHVLSDTGKDSLHTWIEKWTHDDAYVYTDDWHSYNDIPRFHLRVDHNDDEWIRFNPAQPDQPVHTNTIEGFWTGLSILMSRFRGVSKHYLSGYVAIYACQVNERLISASFIHQIVHLHTYPT